MGNETQVFPVHLTKRQSKPRKPSCSRWEHSRFRYLSELMSLEPAALLVVQVEPFKPRGKVDGGGWTTRLSGLLYRNAGGLYWREGWMAEPLALASADDGLGDPFRAHIEDLLVWISRFRGTQKRPSIEVSERHGFEAFTRGLSDERRRWLEQLREAAQIEVAPGTFRWNRW
ncbi:hypothetical protein KHF85_20030 (plasmid) [Xanthomonas translucens pv. graminis]|uniref:hypothetical protein n=1 Tax=Xanthomonas graminis TaxID=3390026 RepID=UPI00253F6FA8|nr:hypothetical protein [Xanthomonas translucens]WIH07073.1 hypothetical protein KHF85_20030 [Xanthomonas translucens pv. graminis]